MVAGVVLAALLAALHLLAGRIRFRDIPRSQALSVAGGISVAYVFVHLLPELAATSEHVAGIVPLTEHATYVLGLLGLALFYGVERSARNSTRRRSGHAGGLRDVGTATWLSFASYGTYNAVIGYLLVREPDQVMFAVAMGLHFVVNDHALRSHHRDVYDRAGRWLLALAIVVGALIGTLTTIGEAVIGALVAFIAGGVILNVMKEELPEDRASSFGAFAAGAAGYTLLLLAIP